jgi:chromosome segregation ATPase
MMSKTLIEGVVGENVKLRRKLQSIKDNKVEIRKLETALAGERKKVVILRQRCDARNDKIRGLRELVHNTEKELRQAKRECRRRVAESQEAAEGLVKQLSKKEQALRDANARAEALHDRLSKIFDSLKGLL